MPDSIESRERLARLEQKLEHIVEKVDKISDRQAVIHDAMLQAQGAAWLGRWLLPGATGVIGFVASKLGTGAMHLP